MQDFRDFHGQSTARLLDDDEAFPSSIFTDESLVIMTVDEEVRYVDTSESNFVVYDQDNNPVVSVNCNTGEVILGKGKSASDGAQEFWNVVETMGRSRLKAYNDLISQLTKTANDRNDYISKLTKEIEQLKNTGTTSPDQQDNRFEAMTDEL